MTKYAQALTSKYGSQHGYLLVLVIMTSFALMLVAVALLSVSASKYARTGGDIDAAQAIYAAEAGISDTLNRLNENDTFDGYVTKKEFYNTTAKGKAEYTTSIEDGPSGTLIVSSTGYVSKTSSSATPSATRTIRAILTRATQPINENVIAGSAGMIMSGPFLPLGGQPAAMNKGMIYSRGKIKLNGGSTSIGSVNDSARVHAANVACGTGSSFPQQCATNDPPLVFSSAVFSSGTGKIYGSVCATDQPYPNTNVLPGSTGAGLQQGCVAPDYGIPKFDRKEFTDAASTTVAASSMQCPSTNGVLSAVTWAANTRVNSNVTVEGNSSYDCPILVKGNVYIKGNLTLDRRARLTVDTDGTEKPVILVTGKVVLKETMTGVFANAAGSHLTIISLWSTDADCMATDDCTSISSSNLYNSSVISNNATWYTGGNRAITFERMLFSGGNPNISGLAAYSYFGSTLYGFDGSRSVRGIGGQEVIINPGGAVSFSGGGLSVTDISPFAHVLYRNAYAIGDYLQQF